MSSGSATVSAIGRRHGTELIAHAPGRKAGTDAQEGQSKPPVVALCRGPGLAGEPLALGGLDALDDLVVCDL
jgi:hypothetical protein